MLWEWKKEKKVNKLRKILRFLDVSVLFFLNPRKDSKDEFIKEKLKSLLMKVKGESEKVG